jgi:hypothetical protein
MRELTMTESLMMALDAFAGVSSPHREKLLAAFRALPMPKRP